MAARPLSALVVLAVSLGASAAPAQNARLFSTYEPLHLRIEAPFNELFARGEPHDESGGVTGTLTYEDQGRSATIGGVQISLRGHTSLRVGECTFPKLKVRLPADRAGDRSPFDGRSTLKIATHCGESAGGAITSKYGRLANEQSPRREAFVYRLLDALDVPTLKVRPARMTYVYTDGPASQTPGRQQAIARSAFLVEDDHEAVARLGGVRQITEQAFTSAQDQFSTSDTATVALAEAMIGNFDWCLKMTAHDAYRCNARHPLWNVLAIVGADGRVRPLIYDFDVSGIVAGRHRWFAEAYNEAFVPSRSHAAVEVLGQVQRTRTLFNRRDLDATRARFMQKKADAYRVLESADLDPDGKRLAKEYLDAFFEAIGSDEAFYRPAVVRRGARVFDDASQARAACASAGTVPVGTVVGDPLETTDRMMRVVVLDTTWHWATPHACAAIHESPVWIEASAVSRDFPPR